MLADLLWVGGNLAFAGSAAHILMRHAENYARRENARQSLPVQEIVPPLPVPKWSREDARRSAEMYRKVPSAFWLAPEYTRFDGPEERGLWLDPEQERRARQIAYDVKANRAMAYSDRWHAGPTIAYWQDRRVLSMQRDIARDGYVLRLEDKEGEGNTVFVTHQMMA